MTDDQEKHWLLGNRAAYVSLLGECLRHLGYDETKLARAAYEREQAVAALRSACDEHGDNDWDDNLHLADVIQKHLVQPWEEREEDQAYERKEYGS